MFRKIFFTSLTLFFCLSKTMDMRNPDRRLVQGVQKTDSGLVKAAITAGADVNNMEVGQTPLACAAEWGYLEIAKLLVQCGAAIDSRGIRNQTPLFRAVEGNHLALVEFLINVGADVNRRDLYNNSPLHETVLESSSYLMIEFLARHGSNMDAQDIDGNAPLHFFAEIGIAQRFQWLVVHGADPYLVNNKGKTPLTLFSEVIHGFPLLKAILTSNPKGAQRILLSHYYEWLPIHLYSTLPSGALAPSIQSPSGGYLAFDSEAPHINSFDLELEVAAALGYEDLVKTIFTHFSSYISPHAIISSLIAAAAHGHVDLFAILLNLLNPFGPDVSKLLTDSQFDDSVRKALFWAVLNNRPYILNLLLEWLLKSRPKLLLENTLAEVAATGNISLFTIVYDFIRQHLSELEPEPERQRKVLASAVEEALHSSIVYRRFPITAFIIQHAFVQQELPELNPARARKYIRMLLQTLPAYERATLTDILDDLATVAHVRSLARVTETEDGAPISALAKALSRRIPMEIIAMILSFILHPPRQGKPS